MTARRLGQKMPGEWISFLQEQLQEIDKGGQASLWAYANASLAELLIRNGKLGQAKEILETVEAHRTAITDRSVLALINLTFGLLQARSGEVEQSLASYRTARFNAALAKDVSLAIYARHNEGVVLMTSGATLDAIDVLNDVKTDMAKLRPDDALLNVLQFNLSYLKNLTGKHEEALAGFRRTQDWLNDSQQLTRGFIAATQIAHALNALNRPQEAVDELAPWLERSDLSLAADSRLDALHALGRAHLLSNSSAQSSAYIQEAKRILAAEPNPVREMDLVMLEADYLLHHNEAQAATRLLESQIAALDAQAPTHRLVGLMELQANAYEILGRPDAAYQVARKIVETERVLRTTEHDRRLIAMQTSNDLDLKQREVELLRANERENEIRRRTDRLLLIAFCGIGLLLAVVAYQIGARLLRERRMRATLENQVELRTGQAQEEMNRRVNAERDRAHLETRLAEDDKTRAIAQLTGGLAHDFNNLLTVISCSAELIEVKAAQDPILTGLARDIMSATDSGANVTRALIAYARQQPLHPTVTRLDHFFEQHRSLFQNTLGEGVELTLNTIQAYVQVDTGSLTTTILNLLFNARDAVPEHGKVSISVTVLIKPDQDSQVCVSVSDNGNGMSDEVLANAWEPFFTTKSGANGSGLGLSMVYGFMKQSSGEMRLSSELGTGTTVYLYFPLHEPVGEEDSPANSVTHISSARAGRVLFVEDQDSILKIAVRALESNNFEVTAVHSGAQAFAVLDSNQKFELVITDIVMPGRISGIDVAARVRELYPDTGILLTSGHADAVPVEYDFLAKPYSMKTLLNLAQMILDRRRDEGSVTTNETGHDAKPVRIR
ncbi:MAG: ATP-binding protein [Pseudomonadota bacterium]